MNLAIINQAYQAENLMGSCLTAPMRAYHPWLAALLTSSADSCQNLAYKVCNAVISIFLYPTLGFFALIGTLINYCHLPPPPPENNVPNRDFPVPESESIVDLRPSPPPPASNTNTAPPPPSSLNSSSLGESYVFIEEKESIETEDKTKLKYTHSLRAVNDAIRKNPTKSAEKLKIMPRLENYILNAEIPDECAENAYAALKALDQCENPLLLIQERYRAFIQTSRVALQLAKERGKLDPPVQEAVHFLEWVHHIKYTSVPMYPVYREFLKLAFAGKNFPIPRLTSLHDTSRAIREANRSLVSLHENYKDYFFMQWGKIQGTVGALNFDPSAECNTPWVHSLQQVVIRTGEKKIVLVLRHGTPTQDPGPLDFMSKVLPTVALEYEAHLKASHSKQTLYVNHQDYPKEKNGWLGVEEARSIVIQKLETKYDNFHFAAFPMGGPIFRKSWLEEKRVSAKDFKDTLFNSLINGENGFALPRTINPQDRDFQGKINRILVQVHELYFQNQEFASPKEKVAFIMIFYSYVKNLLKSELNIDFIVSACKDNKDRGNASNLVDMAIAMLLLGKENDAKCLEELFFSALGPVIIKYENIIEERLEMALAALGRMAYLVLSEKEAIRREFPGMTGLQIVGQSVPK